MPTRTADPGPAPVAAARTPKAIIGAGVRRLRVALSALLAAVLGLLPHVLHHVGPLAGAALFAGVGGTLLFGAVGLVAALPFLLRVHRRCGTWRMPAVLLATFAAMFSLSAFVIGPAITGGGDEQAEPAITTPGGTPPGSHEEHH